jgi:MFS family permease
MLQDRPLTGAKLRTPKAAAVAGMLFSILVIAAFWLMWVSVPADPQEPGSWLHGSANTVALAVTLFPFSGIALLWFIAVLRDRLGQREDRFFATVFLGSGLLFLAMLFTAAAAAGAILIAFVAEPEQLINSATYHFARAVTYNILNVYMIKMAAVFMFTTSTLAIYTALVTRWLAILGYVLALLLLFGSYYLRWSFLIFPLWVFLVSIYIVLGDFRRPRES